MKIHYGCTLLAVRDMARSKAFYASVLGLGVQLDLGKNVGLEGNIALQEDFAWLTNVDPASVVFRAHNAELYFEVDDFDAFMEKLRARDDIVYVHPPKTYPWKQRVVRIEDPDGHMIEIGEAMAVIARRYLDAGKTVAETAELIQHPVAFVQAVVDGHIPV